MNLILALVASFGALAFDAPIDEKERVDLTAVLDGTFEAMGLEAPEVVGEVPWPVRTKGLAGRAQLRAFELAFQGGIDLDRQGDVMRVTIDRDEMAEAAGRTPVETWLRDRASIVLELRPAARRFGLRAPDGPWLAAGEDASPLGDRVVILVHGLDDPGWMWRDVTARLNDEDYTVLWLEYANDGPIAEAADLFAAELITLRARGVERIDVVAHSMGGLVTRDLLTRAEHYGGDGAGGDRLPAIDHLIMCGTPNHGSELARLRAVSEIGEQIGRLVNGGDLLGGMADGDGEAGRDLLPGSAFLRRLNERDLASHTEHVVIAGRVSPLDESDIEKTRLSLQVVARAANAPAWVRRFINDANDVAVDVFDAAVDGVGDGCVTLDSARLEGASFIEVEADHVGMIVGLTPNAKPPVIPIILDVIADEEEGR